MPCGLCAMPGKGPLRACLGSCCILSVLLFPSPPRRKNLPHDFLHQRGQVGLFKTEARRWHAVLLDIRVEGWGQVLYYHILSLSSFPWLTHCAEDRVKSCIPTFLGPMAPGISPSTPTGSRTAVILRRIQRPPHANPTLKALSMRLKAWVELPSPRRRR